MTPAPLFARSDRSNRVKYRLQTAIDAQRSSSRGESRQRPPMLPWRENTYTLAPFTFADLSTYCQTFPTFAKPSQNCHQIAVTQNKDRNMSQQRQTTIDALTQAAHAIAMMPQSEYAGWIAYLCEGIESQTDAPADDWIADAIAALTERLVTGQW